MVAHSDRTNQWAYSSSNWTGESEVGSLPSTYSLTANLNYRSPAYGDIPANKVMVRTFTTDLSPNAVVIKFTMPSAKTAQHWFSDPPVQGSSYAVLAGSLNMSPSVYRLGAGGPGYTCHNYAGGIYGRICMYQPLDSNSARYFTWGGDYLGRAGDVWPGSTSYMTSGSTQILYYECPAGGSVDYYSCDEGQFSIWVKE
jgi:hypothetical protein